MFEVVRCLESALAASQERITLQSTGSVNEVSFRDLNQATRGFSRDLLVSEGGGRRVFLGWVEKKTLAPLEEGVGIAVAVQWITSEIPQIHNEWLEEVNFFGQLAHPNIISLLGFCNKNEHERLLVYERINTSLSQFIHGDDHLEPLSWDTRLKVMIGVVRGPTHLYTEKGVMCHFLCDDILLDEVGTFMGHTSYFRILTQK
ncbi:putative protein kinase RLK-Pelle-RLCK-VIIa-2 family [Helianthus annuus]|nr:putative protein kinase RLK-Pelle-RLCK-VIIa-2 family [Helianthus annuus]